MNLPYPSQRVLLSFLRVAVVGYHCDRLHTASLSAWGERGSRTRNAGNVLCSLMRSGAWAVKEKELMKREGGIPMKGGDSP